MRHVGERQTAAFRAMGRSVVIRPADKLERLAGFLFRHARDPGQIQAPGGCGKEEVLGHLLSYSLSN